MTKKTLMLCEKFTPEEAKQVLNSDWVLEPKFDGLRATISGGKLFNRSGDDITHKYPEFTNLAQIKGYLDGEIMASSGQFNDISGRVHLKDIFKITLAARMNPAIFMAFDLVPKPGAIIGRPADVLEERRRELLAVADIFVSSFPEGSDWLQVTPRYEADGFDDLWADVLANGSEGLLAKRKGSAYEFRRSSNWRKIKSFIEVQATFVKYEPNSHGITLETADGRRVVVNGAEAKKLTKMLSTGSINCNIQYLPQSDSGAWRFPSYRGIVK